MVREILRKIGLTEGEIKVYLALLDLGSTTTGKIIEKSGVSGSKVYEILERLMQKGFVSFIIKEKTKYFQAEDPIKIQNYLDKKEQELKEQKQEISKIIPSLQAKKNKPQEQEEAQIYKGFKGIQTIIEKVYLRLKKGESYCTMGIPSFQEEKYHDYWKKDHLKRSKAGFDCKLLFNQGTDIGILKNRNSFKGADARYMPIKIDTPSWILVYKNVTAIILQSQTEFKEALSIEIINQSIADSFQAYFDAFWKLSKKIKK